MILSIFSVLISFIIGFCTLSFIDRKQELDILQNKLFKYSLSVGIGFGISSILVFLWLIIIGNLIHYYIFEIVLAAVLFSFYLFKIKKTKEFIISKQRSSLILKVLFGVFIIISAISCGLHFLNMPHGENDAQYIWNYKARCLYRSENHQWKQTFNLNTAHPYYPLLVPSAVAKTWSYTKHETQFTTAVISFTYIFSILGLLVSSVSFFTSPNLAYIAGMFLLSCPHFLYKGMDQIADIPLSYYFLASTILISSIIKEKSYKILLLAGLTTGFSLWTKNEGFIFLAILLLTLAIFNWKSITKISFKKIKYFVYGILPALAVCMFFKKFIAPPDNFMVGQTFAVTLSKMFDISRYLTILQYYFNTFLNNFMGSWLVLAAFVAFIFLNKININNTKIFQFLISLFTLMLSAYFMIYVITPCPLEWHLQTSLLRLMLQVFPIFIFSAFVSLKTR